jgi:hypothetical protein
VDFANYGYTPREFYEDERVVFTGPDGRKRYGHVVELAGPNPVVVFDGDDEKVECAAEDTFVTVGNYPEED